MVADRQLRKKQITAQREEQLLSAAADVFTRRGYAAATVPEIAAAAGVSVGTIYNYYPSKRELFIAIVKQMIITTPLLELIDRMPRTDIATTLRDIMRNRLNLVENETIARMPSLIGEIQRDPELKELWARQFIYPFMQRLEGIYRDLMAAGKFKELDPALVTRTFGGLIIGFMMLKVMEFDLSPIDRIPPQQVADGLVEILLHGIMKPETEEPK